MITDKNWHHFLPWITIAENLVIVKLRTRKIVIPFYAIFPKQ